MTKCFSPGVPGACLRRAAQQPRFPPGLLPLCHRCLAGSTGVGDSKSPRHHPLGPVKCLSGLPASCPQGPGKAQDASLHCQLYSAGRFAQLPEIFPLPFLSVGTTPPQPVMTTQKEECLWGRSVYTITSHGMRHETGSHEVVPTSPPVPAVSPGEHFCPARLLQLTGSLSGGLETSGPVRSCHIMGSLVLVW